MNAPFRTKHQESEPPRQESLNQTPPLVDYNLFASDAALQESIRREGAGDAVDPAAFEALMHLGTDLGRADHFEAAYLANHYPPVLHTHNPRGQRIDRVSFHPAWHVLMRSMVAYGFHCSPWQTAHETGPLTHTLRAAGYFMQAQIEQGSLCPITMTYGAIPAIRTDSKLAREWLPKLLSREYDPSDQPFVQKRGGLIGMGMTEKQGGSDVRANTTRAERQPDGCYRITGHKWFFSAPQSDAHLVLAQTESGLSCFFMPRYEPDGAKNAIHIQRLKDKVGNRSNASSEVEFHQAWGHLLGEEGRGVPAILEMGTYTRLDCVIGTAGMMRQAMVQAIHHARHRKTFGKFLIEQPLMQSVLADLALESEAATVLALRLAHAFDHPDDETETAFRRLMTSAAKFWVCKRGPEFAAEAMEVLGGNGYVEEGVLARIYREMPVNSIWEGSGNIMCLDVLRALSKSPKTVESVLAELHQQRGSNSYFDAALDALSGSLSSARVEETDARRLVQTLVTLMQASLLLQSESSLMADAFCATRLAGQGWGAVYGTLPKIECTAILDRAWSE